ARDVTAIDLVDDQVVVPGLVCAGALTQLLEDAVLADEAHLPIHSLRPVTFEEVLVAIRRMERAELHVTAGVPENLTALLGVQVGERLAEHLTRRQLTGGRFGPKGLAGAGRPVEDHLSFAIENCLDAAGQPGQANRRCARARAHWLGRL